MGIEPMNLILTKDALCLLSYSSVTVLKPFILKGQNKGQTLTLNPESLYPSRFPNPDLVLTKDALYLLSYESK